MVPHLMNYIKKKLWGEIRSNLVSKNAHAAEYYTKFEAIVKFLSENNIIVDWNYTTLFNVEVSLTKEQYIEFKLRFL